jgi:broad specificity phosphatase PhoE
VNRRTFTTLLFGFSLLACNKPSEAETTAPAQPEVTPEEEAATPDAGAEPETEATAAKTIFIVRHAEKQVIEGERNPELTEAGHARAKALPEALGDVKIDEVYSSDYKRTQQTAAPVAEAAGVEIVTYNAADTPALTARLLDSEATNILVAGHSNTVPALIGALGADEPTITDDQYGDLFVVTVEGEQVALETRHFGP